jgi:hypothetical protein
LTDGLNIQEQGLSQPTPSHTLVFDESRRALLAAFRQSR